MAARWKSDADVRAETWPGAQPAAAKECCEYGRTLPHPCRWGSAASGGPSRGSSGGWRLGRKRPPISDDAPPPPALGPAPPANRRKLAAPPRHPEAAAAAAGARPLL